MLITEDYQMKKIITTHKRYQIVDLKQQSPEWHEFRRGKIGASMAPTIMGENPYQTRLSLWEDMVFDRKKSITKAMQRGTDLEEKARGWLNDELNTRYLPTVIQSIKHPDIIASLDGYYEDDDGDAYLCEIKCPGLQTHLKAVEGEIPSQYYAQLQHQMALAEVDEILYVSFDGEDGVILVCKRDEEYCHKLLCQELVFLTSIIDLKPPEASDMDWKQIVDPAQILKALRLSELNTLADEIDLERESLRKELIEKCDHPRCMVGDLKLQKIIRKGNIDYEKLLKDYKITETEKYRKSPTESWRIISS